MAKSKKRTKVKRREKGASRGKGSSSSGSSSGGSKKKSRGAMMGMRSGFKGIAGSLVGQQSPHKKTRKVVDVFWWIATIVLGAVAVYFLYQRFGR